MKLLDQDDTFNALRKWTYEDTRAEWNKIIISQPGMYMNYYETIFKEKTGWTHKEFVDETFFRIYGILQTVNHE